jgi:RNA polymerase sigma-70 factor (ECF subfamily)
LGKKNISVLPDEELLQQYRDSGDSLYFGELYNRYIPLVYGVCLKYLHNTDKSQDAVMRIFENLLPKISQYEIAVFRTWLYSVVKNHCLQVLRKENREIAVDFNADLMESEEVLHLLEEEETDSERMDALRHCLDKLPERQRTVIIRFFMDEMSYADIADCTEYNLNQVKSYIQNGKRNLRICIEKYAP